MPEWRNKSLAGRPKIHLKTRRRERKGGFAEEVFILSRPVRRVLLSLTIMGG